jgi:adenosylcobinamide-phosphate synthase
VAVALDLALGDPPNRWHPVAWLGRLIAWGRCRLERWSDAGRLAGGALLALGIAVIAGLAGWLVATAGCPGIRCPAAIGVIREGIALKIAISLRGLFSAARLVGAGLQRGDLDSARRAVGLHLVSRPTQGLTPPQVASAAIESIAENLTDAGVAPLCFYMVWGVPGAYVYRAINTADARIGYRTGSLEMLGKTVARLDDLFNWLPARLAGLAIVAGAGLAGGSARGAWRIMLRDHAVTASPNAGWTMAAMAGAVGVALEKPGAYRLGEGPAPSPDDLGRGLAVLAASAALAVLLLVGLGLAAARMTRGTAFS